MLDMRNEKNEMILYVGNIKYQLRSVKVFNLCSLSVKLHEVHVPCTHCGVTLSHAIAVATSLE